MSRLSRLREAIFGAPEKSEINQGAAVVSPIYQSTGVRPSTSFLNQLTVYREDPVIHEAILQMAQQIISTGFFVTGNESYTATMPTGPKGRAWSAKEAISYWNKLNNLDEKGLQIAIELIAFGNSFWNITQDGFTNIPIEAVQQALAVNETTSIREKYFIELTATYGGKKIPFDEFAHFHTEPIGNGPMGSGIILGLIATPEAVDDVEVPSLYEIRKSQRASMKEGFRKFSFGNELWTFEGVPDGVPASDGVEATGIYALGDKLRDMPTTGQRIATNVKGNVILALPQRTQSYDKWIEQTENEFLMALANPSLKLGLEQGFTKATAEAARVLYEMKIMAHRRIIKRHIEAIWAKVLAKLGFDSDAADMRLNFGSQEIEYTPADLLAAVDKRIISADEARHILQKQMKWDISEKAPPMPPAVTPTPAPNLAAETLKLKMDNDAKLEELRLRNEQKRSKVLDRLLAQ